jgi:pimeloyl-ACP methyl ester carboxylesterase
MDALIHRISAWDGLPLHVREWRDGETNPPILCLPGLVRTSGDFSHLAPAIGAGRRMISLDYAGRGGSGRSPSVARYGPEACLRDVIDVCAALHLHRVVAIGTSFGGLLCMGLGAARPGLLRGVVLNDVGPEIGSDGSDFVRRFVADDPALPSLDACMAWLRERLPPMSLVTDEEWREMAALTYAPGPDGRFHPLWDTRMARLLTRKPPDLWPLFDALNHVPLLLIRGGVSNILLPETAARMKDLRPDMEVLTLDHVGHAPSLIEPECVAALRAFVGSVTPPPLAGGGEYLCP